MAINPHDDYEALAKLLYPSIEASGNVYYGQTRKLTIDELFDKNNNGFESYFCSCRKEDDSSQYEQHFHWKLGPFSDTVKIVDETYKDYPLAWLKYTLIKKETEHTNKLSAGEYSTYDVEYILGKSTLYCSLDGLLPDGDMYNNSNFFLDTDDKALYVLLYKAPVYEDMDKPLYIEALTDDITVRLVRTAAIDYEQCEYKYGFDHTDLTNDLTLDDGFAVKKGRRIYIRCENRPQFSSTAYLRLEIESNSDSTEVAVGGNIESLAKFEDNEMLAYAYCGLFSGNSLITDASKLYIGKVSNNSCRYLFSNCSRLVTAPAILPCFELKTSCFHNMFVNCSELENAPILPARDGALSCYWSMFERDGNDTVSKLNKVVCLLSQWRHSYTPEWLDGRAGIKIYALQNSNWDPSDESAVPPHSKIVYLDSVTSKPENKVQVSNKPIEKYLITHGTNNENNGRGDITNPSTLSNMEKSFDENNNHPMNTYNNDGSFNQEIWGYKSFCSPVQFRNGIYGEDWSILSTYESGNTGPYVEYIETGSVIKHEKNDDLKIELINRKSHNTEDDIYFEDNTFLVPLRGYTNSEKQVNCFAKLRSTNEYEYTDPSTDVITSRIYTSEIISQTFAGLTQSSISTSIGTAGSMMVSAYANVATRISNDEPCVVLTVSDSRGTQNIPISSSLTISKTESEFSDDVIVGRNLTVKDTIIANAGIASLGDIIVADGKTIHADNIVANDIKADNWNLSPSAVAGILGGLPSTPDGSTSTEYGKAGTLGLFKIGYYVAAGGYMIPGTDLYPIVITYDDNNMLKVQVRNTPVADAESRWIALTPTENEHGDNNNNICLAIRWR